MTPRFPLGDRFFGGAGPTGPSTVSGRRRHGHRHPLRNEWDGCLQDRHHHGGAHSLRGTSPASTDPVPSVFQRPGIRPDRTPAFYGPLKRLLGLFNAVLRPHHHRHSISGGFGGPPHAPGRARARLRLINQSALLGHQLLLSPPAPAPRPPDPPASPPPRTALPSSIQTAPCP